MKNEELFQQMDIEDIEAQIYKAQIQKIEQDTANIRNQLKIKEEFWKRFFALTLLTTPMEECLALCTSEWNVNGNGGWGTGSNWNPNCIPQSQGDNSTLGLVSASVEVWPSWRQKC